MQAARQRPHDLQPARQLHGAPHRRLPGLVDLGRDLQRAVRARRAAVPGHFIPAAMLPQSPGRRPQDLHPRAGEVRQAVRLRRHQPEPRSVGRALDLAAAVPTSTGTRSTRRWSNYDIPAMIHVSTSCNACFHTTGAHYLNADTTAFMQCLISGDLFKDFPTLNFLIPHGGGAAPYHWGRLPRAGAGAEEAAAEGPPAEQHLLRHLRLPPARHRPADQGDPGRQHPVRQRDDRRGARHRSRDRLPLRRHQALHRGLDAS